MKRTLFNGIVYNSGSRKDFVKFVLNEFTKSDSSGLIIVHVNIRNYYYMHKTDTLYNFIKNNCFTVFEGIGMKCAFYLKGLHCLYDLNGTDSVPELFSKIDSNTGVYLLGATDDVIRIAVQNIKQSYPGLKLTGYNSGFFNCEEESTIIKEIIESGTNILLIGRGFPLDVEFIERNYEKLKNIHIWNVGGLFDFLSGKKKRAPKILLKFRLEWLYRMSREPRRMLFRNTVAAYWSVYNILTGKAL